MDNKTIIVVAIISAIGSFFEPTFTPKDGKNKKDNTTCKTEQYIDSIRLVNDSLLHSLKMENKALLKDNKRLKRKRKYYITKNGKKIYR